MPQLYDEDSWLSGYALMRDPRIWCVDQHDNISIRPAQPSELIHGTFTALVIVTSATAEIDTLVSLANTKSNVRVVVVCADPTLYDSASWFPSKYSLQLPKCAVFRPNTKLTIRHAIMAGVQEVRTPYFVVLGPHSMVHREAFSRLSPILSNSRTDVLRVRCFGMNDYGWAWYRNNWQKPVWRTTCVLGCGGFQGDGTTVETVERELLGRLMPTTVVDQIDDVLFCVKG